MNPDGSCGPLNFPQSGSRYHQLTNSIRYRLPHGLTPRFEYRFGRWDRNDYQFGVIQPYMFPLDSGLRTSVFLGGSVPRYNTHMLSFSLGYTF